MRIQLKVAIYRAGTTQRRLAHQTDISENRLSQIVQGWVEPTPREQTAIAAAVRAPPENLFAETAGASMVPAVEVS